MNQQETEIENKPSGVERNSAPISPTLKFNFISHGTLETKDIDFARKFFEEFMGFEVIRTS